MADTTITFTIRCVDPVAEMQGTPQYYHLPKRGPRNYDRGVRLSHGDELTLEYSPKVRAAADAHIAAGRWVSADEEAPKEEAPKEEAPKEEAPKEEAPKEEAPKEAPKEVPAKKAAAKKSAAKKSSSKKN